MVTHATIADLRRRGRRMLAEDRASVRARAASRSPRGATFLSHASRDGELLSGVIALLEEHGATVFIDKKDADLPVFTSKETAATLRSRIAAASKLIILATKASKDSRWIPWELGFCDGKKGLMGVAILPGVDSMDDVAWAEREYLGLYRRIVHGRIEGYPEPVWMVHDRTDNKATELSKWLAS